MLGLGTSALAAPHFIDPNPNACVLCRQVRSNVPCRARSMSRWQATIGGWLGFFRHKAYYLIVRHVSFRVETTTTKTCLY